MYLEENLYTKVPLKCNEDGKFKIFMFSDSHGHRKETLDSIRATVLGVKPDLVLIGGDTVHEMEPYDPETPDVDSVYEYLKSVTQVMEENHIPWAHVFGNHDNNIGMSNHEQQPAYERFPYNVAKRGPAELPGIGNYVLPIMSHDGKEIVYNVWGIDSHDSLGRQAKELGIPEILNGKLPKGFTDPTNYAFITFEQQMWYWNSSVEMEKHCGKKIPGLMFFHIPLPEFWLAQENPQETNLKGYRGEACGNSFFNSGLFTTVLQRKDVKTICCGHDHDNNFEADYCGIKLCYDGALSYNGYNRHTIRGGRVFEIDEKDPWNVKTYIELYKNYTDDPVANENYYD